MAKKAATKPAAKKRPAKRKPVEAVQPVKSSSPWRRSMLVGSVVAGLVASFVGGAWSAGGWQVGPGPIVFNDSLAESHKNDRASQVRILREYADKTFASEPEAQKWLNEQRIAARPDDWGPYTDELGIAADAGPDAVKAFADKLEGKK